MFKSTKLGLRVADCESDAFKILVSQIDDATLPEGTPKNAVASVTTLTSSGVAPTSGKTVTIGSKTYTFRTALTPLEGEVLINTTAANALVNLKAAINHTGSANTDYKCAAVHPEVSAGAIASTTLALAAKVKGVSGDVIQTSTNETTLGFSDTALVNGENGTVAPANATFTDGSYLYIAIDTNTIADANWRRISLGSAY